MSIEADRSVTTRRPAKAFPVSALIEALGAPPHVDTDGGQHRIAGAKWLAMQLDVNVSSVRKWVERGKLLTADEADAHAARLGFHPASVWPNWYQELDRLNESLRVEQEEARRQRRAKYRRRYYRAHRDKERAYAKQWYEAHREEVRQYMREYDGMRVRTEAQLARRREASRAFNRRWYASLSPEQKEALLARNREYKRRLREAKRAS